MKGRWDGRVIMVSAGSGLKFFIYEENVPKYVTFIKANGDIIKGKCRPDGTLYEKVTSFRVDNKCISEL